jgi:hypothetical protein
MCCRISKTSITCNNPGLQRAFSVQIVMGTLKARLMMTGIELRIFNRLETFLSAEDVARDLGTHAEPALRCGFRWVRSRTIETPMGLMDMDIAQK